MRRCSAVAMRLRTDAHGRTNVVVVLLVLASAVAGCGGSTSTLPASMSSPHTARRADRVVLVTPHAKSSGGRASLAKRRHAALMVMRAALMVGRRAHANSSVAAVQRYLMEASAILHGDPRAGSIGRAAEAIAQRFAGHGAAKRRAALMALAALAQQARSLRPSP
jgi:hypothetical protein